jgi:multicomponent Na+:H+ antiporter subunit G
VSGWLPWVGDALVVVGLVVITLGVIGMVRLRDAYTRLHAAAKIASLGLGALLVAGALTAPEAESAYRAVLIAAFLTLTAPIGAHVIARATYLREGSEERREELERRAALPRAERR